jgi:hypothetical protein
LEAVDQAGGGPRADADRARDELAQHEAHAVAAGDDGLAGPAVVGLGRGERLAERRGDTLEGDHAADAEAAQAQQQQVERLQDQVVLALDEP